MSLYDKESPDFLRAALASLQQSYCSPSEVVIVLDGYLRDELMSVLHDYEPLLPLRLLQLPENVGLGPALNEGLKECKYDWVARFDTDDLVRPRRFSQQLSVIQKAPDIDVLGGWITEFAVTPDQPTGVRKVPITHKAIVKYAKKRNPFNHVSVMYRRNKVIEAGGYQDDPFFEDYALWVRMILSGAKCSNIPESVVCVRANNAMYERRGGLHYIKCEYFAQHKFWRMGFISFYRFIFNLVMRVPFRLVPNRVRTLLYGAILRRK